MDNNNLLEEFSNLEDLIAAMPGHIYWKNKDGIYLGCNNEQAIYSGFKSKKEILGKKIHDLLPKHLADKVEADDNFVMNEGKELVLEEIMPNQTTVLSRKIPLKNKTGEVIGMIGVSVDITDKKIKEQELKDSKEKAELTLENIVANMPGHVFWYDKEGKLFQGCNNLQAQSLGFSSSASVIGKSLYELFPKDEAEKIYKTNCEIIDKGEPVTIIENGIYANGQKAIFLSKKIPFKDNCGKIMGLLGVAFDITAEKEAEQLRIEKLAVEESLKAAQLMAASIAHEMRTPLGTISAVAGTQHEFMPALFQNYEAALAENKLEEPLSPRTYQYLKESPDVLMQVVSGANTFINMMLMKFNPDNIKAQNLVKLSMAASVKSALTIYPMSDDERALVNVNTEHDFEFMGDKTLFDHILFNLLKNALHYLKEAQKGEILIWLEPGDKENILHFKDTGKGMPLDVLNNLFGNFYSKTRHGTGVGLALCKMIMQEFKGSISCESIEAEFTHFKMVFPKIN
jgi:PAS domain S-box-containing protein